MAKILNKLMKLASFGDDSAEYRGIADERLENLVQSNTDTSNTVDAEFIRGDVPAKFGKEASAIWPGDIELQVPEDWKFGDPVPAQGPHGRIMLDLPEQCTAGMLQRIRLRPAPDLRVEVPPGLKEGKPMTFERPDGTRISINVPKGKKPGDFFDVAPPAVMVLIPEDTKPGEVVVFPLPGPPSGQWFTATVPEALQLGKYFAARLPPPDHLAGGGPGKGEGKGQTPTKESDDKAKPLVAKENTGNASSSDDDVPVE